MALVALSEADPDINLGLDDLSYLSSPPLPPPPSRLPIPVQTPVQYMVSQPRVMISPPIRIIQPQQVFGLARTDRIIIFVCLVILAIIIFVTLIVTLVVMLWPTSNPHGPPSDPTPGPIVHDIDSKDHDHGASSDGIANFQNAQFLTSVTCGSTDHSVQDHGCECRCVVPFYGPTCNLESWDERFYNLGTFRTGAVTYTGLPTSGLTVKTWDLGGQLDENSCSEIARRTVDAVGFRFSRGMCEILDGDVRIVGPVTYNPLALGPIYLKHEYKPLVSGKVFVTVQGGDALRYYVTRPDSSSFKTIPLNTVTTVAIPPHKIYNFDGAIGIWSKTPFSMANFDTLRASGTVFVDVGYSGSYTISIPSSLRASQYYVAYKA